MTRLITILAFLGALLALLSGLRMLLHEWRTWRASRGLRLLLLLALFTVCSTPALAQVKAFPECEGSGCVATGGRGGAVCMVTNINDSGSGSFRNCLINTSGARTIIFRVGGQINLLSSLYITNANFTIAGQTAPGDGITFAGPSCPAQPCAVNGIFHMFGIDTTNFIVRYIRVSKRFSADQLAHYLANTDAAGANQTAFNNAGNGVWDHTSMWWGQDEGGSYGGFGNFTFSYNIQAENLDPHSTAFLGTGSSPAGVSLHHNLFMNNNHRTPKIDYSNFRYVNNLTYNVRLRALQLDGGNNSADIIGNVYKRGPLNIPPTGTDTHEFYLNGTKSVYLLGNKGWNQSNPAGTQWVMTAQGGGGNSPEVATPAPAGWQRFTPQAALTYPMVPESANTLEATLLPTVGNYRRLNCDGTWTNIRNTQDTRLVTQYTTNTGITALLSRESDAGIAFPTTNGGTPCADADLDGMPDVWEIARGLNPNNALDRNDDQDGDGYTNLEEYLNGSEGGDITPPAPPSGLRVVDIILPLIGPVASVGWYFRRAILSASFATIALASAASHGLLMYTAKAHYEIKSVTAKAVVLIVDQTKKG